MKKLLAIILTLALLLTNAAFAEEDEFAPMPEEAAAFEGTWVCGRASIDMIWEEEGFRVFITWSSSAWEHTEWEYSCLYHEEDHSLVSMPFGSRTEVTFAEDGETAAYNTVYEDGEATFTLDEEGCLIWTDEKENAGQDMRFEKLDPFSGTWVCGRATIEIDWEEEGYRVFITWGSSAWERTEWEYSCLYDRIDNVLISMPFGIRTDVTFAENGEVASYNTVYEDGEATFALDEDGYLIWNDEKENAGQDMRFEWVEILDVDQAV